MQEQLSSTQNYDPRNCAKAHIGLRRRIIHDIMAPKKPGESTTRSNKIRFVLVEADISDGNLSELTNAISSALKPSIISVHRQLPARPVAQVLSESNEAVPSSQVEEDETEADTETQENVNGNGAEPKPSRAKKFKSPDYLPDLFAGDKGVAFREFAKEKAPSSKNAKYLVATYWLKEKGDSTTVNANKIYTAFKTAGWSTGFNDWNQTFHNLVHSELLRKVGNGEFAINPLGEDSVAQGTE